MALVRPFRALRPEAAIARTVASVPYDVVTTDEARALAAGNPLSFLHVSRSEIDLVPGADPYSEVVYATAAANLERLRRDAPLVVEAVPSLYVYRLRQNGHEQTGLAACYSLNEYDLGTIRRHERTRPDKENDRTRHLLALRAQTGVVFLTYRSIPATEAVLAQGTRDEPLFDVHAPDGVRHTVWRLGSDRTTDAMSAFATVPVLYIADGHHRIASAARARDEFARAGVDGGSSEARFVLGVAFPDSETRIQAYNRTLDDLGGHTPQGLLEALRARFPVRPNADPVPPPGQVAMYLGGAWYAVELPPGVVGGRGNAAERLDVAVLQDQLLAPLLQVADIRTDPRVTFVGGVRGTSTLEHMVDTGIAAVAFSLAPVTADDLFAVSDSGGMMPPKSTWFEPKLRDGLLIHEI